MVCGMQDCGSCGGQWGAEGSREGQGAPKPNQNLKSIPNQAKPNQIKLNWTKTQPHNLYLKKRNKNWTANPNQTKWLIAPKPNQNWKSIPNQTKPNQKNFTKPNLTKPNQSKTKQKSTKPNQAKTNQTKLDFNQVS